VAEARGFSRSGMIWVSEARLPCMSDSGPSQSESTRVGTHRSYHRSLGHYWARPVGERKPVENLRGYKRG
jgi:hypothetical protein